MRVTNRCDLCPYCPEWLTGARVYIGQTSSTDSGGEEQCGDPIPSTGGCKDAVLECNIEGDYVVIRKDPNKNAPLNIMELEAHGETVNSTTTTAPAATTTITTPSTSTTNATSITSTTPTTTTTTTTTATIATVPSPFNTVGDEVPSNSAATVVPVVLVLLCIVVAGVAVLHYRKNCVSRAHAAAAARELEGAQTVEMINNPLHSSADTNDVVNSIGDGVAATPSAPATGSQIYDPPASVPPAQEFSAYYSSVVDYAALNELDSSAVYTNNNDNNTNNNDDDINTTTTMHGGGVDGAGASAAMYTSPTDRCAVYVAGGAAAYAPVMQTGAEYAHLRTRMAGDHAIYNAPRGSGNGAAADSAGAAGAAADGHVYENVGNKTRSGPYENVSSNA